LITRKEAYKEMMNITLKNNKELNEFLFKIQPEMNEFDFREAKLFVGRYLATFYDEVLVPVTREFPELWPPERSQEEGGDGAA
jgi:hypothetical protein